MLLVTENECVGIDEAGRGCLAFPVFTAAVTFPINIVDMVNDKQKEILDKIKDSKKLSEKRREEYAKFIEQHALAFGITSSSVEEIDNKNILQATIDSMHRSINIVNNTIPLKKIIVDGNHFKPYYNSNNELVNHSCIASADDKYLDVAAASILAKVYRDRFVLDYCRNNPQHDEWYKFSKNKAYGTKDHLDAIKKYGAINHHRKSFAPMRNMYMFLDD